MYCQGQSGRLAGPCRHFLVAFEGGYWHYRLINLQEEYVRKELTVAEDWRPIADICLDRMTTP
ncbi:hypothetical protein MPLB_1680106 [Mesorhizobium sp. ORS 3324]|nr:hypothetical protein MPLB_1680106 [Mesorhizobium sp. ORS 3324]